MNSNEQYMRKERTLSDWQEELWKTHVSKGWNNIKRSPLETHALITTEIAEATEAVRSGIEGTIIVNGKPEGEFIELADAIIRILNYFNENNVDADFLLDMKNEYNKTREPLHGKRI